MSIVQKQECVCDGCGTSIPLNGITISGEFEISLRGNELDGCGEHIGVYQRDYCDATCFGKHIQALEDNRVAREALKKKSREGKPYPASVKI